MVFSDRTGFKTGVARVTVNRERYCEIINKFNTELGQRFTVHQKSRMWFQQDGAMPHTAHNSLNLLKEFFGSRVISFRTTHEWAPHSSDLNPLDFWFWGASKGEVYANKPTTLDQLKQSVKAYAANVTGETCRKVAENFCLRIKACLSRCGAHIEHVYFKNNVWMLNKLPSC